MNGVKNKKGCWVWAKPGVGSGKDPLVSFTGGVSPPGELTKLAFPQGRDISPS
ncbi:MAG: hypothetical protein HRT70_08870 [Flavobacteriaceae bacterium]|nr:hypothetical protein [Flavobacteriaceae bacterium]